MTIVDFLYLILAIAAIGFIGRGFAPLARAAVGRESEHDNPRWRCDMKPLWQEALEAYDRACLWRALR